MACYSISLGILLKKDIFWILTPIFITFSFFSKQIPSSYFIVLSAFIILIYFYFLKSINKNVLKNLFIGILLSLSLITSVFLINEIPIKNFITQYILYPFSLGESRVNALNINFNNLVSQFKFIYFILIPLLISTVFLGKIKRKSLVQKKELLISIYLLSVINKKSGINFFSYTYIWCIFTHIYKKIF
jgi:hypothetical protein